MIEFKSKKLENGQVLHTLKCVEPFYHQVEQGLKTFEIRKDDREYQYSEGDSICLYQVKEGVITGNWIVRKITYVLRFAENFGLKHGYVILAIK